MQTAPHGQALLGRFTWSPSLFFSVAFARTDEMIALLGTSHGGTSAVFVEPS